MLEREELTQEQLEAVTGGAESGLMPGYWYGVHGDLRGYKFSDVKHGYTSAAKRDEALNTSLTVAQNIGVENITSEKGRI